MKNDLQIQFKEFEGPLDLLLSLIDERKMEISDVSISKVTEKFIQYLETLEESNPEELADFLVVAAKLLFNKSKYLLNSIEPIEDEGPPLEEQLKLYRLFVKVSRRLNEQWLGEKRSYMRIEPPHIPENIPLPENLTRETWTKAIAALLQKIKPPKALPQTRIDRTISLKETISRLKELITREREAHFSAWVGDTATKTEIIVSFLALLELVKQREVDIGQNHAFSDIHIAKI